MATGRQWAGSTFGGHWLHSALMMALRVPGRRACYAFAALFVVPVCLLLPGARHAWRYLRQRQGYNPLRALWALYVNHVLFSQVVIDRFAMYAGRRFKVTMQGYEHFDRLSRQPGGFVQLSAHVGNYEIAGYTLVAQHKPMNALVFGGEKATVMAGRSSMFGHSNITMIPVMPDMSHLFAINQLSLLAKL